ncbi:DUF502 domain-containing protein [Geminicoccaceae bacterium 1502E]|nr:DUF502 domain-containing protein [Geminicoccaceae bacterium 1502E]
MEKFQRNIVAGLFVIIPILITVWIVRVVLDALIEFGRPLVTTLARTLQPTMPELSEMLLTSQFQWVAALLATLLLLYCLGALTTAMIGRRVLGAFDRLIARIPFVKMVYGATRKLMASFQEAPAGDRRVVLIEFPSPEMKALGLVTRTFRAADTGQELAAVYVPTTPNPTSGYMEIVPVERLVWLDWTANDAMNFIVSGGTLAPDTMNYARTAPREVAARATETAS